MNEFLMLSTMLSHEFTNRIKFLKTQEFFVVYPLWNENILKIVNFSQQRLFIVKTFIVKTFIVKVIIRINFSILRYN